MQTEQKKPYRTPGEIDISKDGVDYINIYSNATTELGRIMSHFSHTPFTHPYFGYFVSMEGYWYYMRAREKDDRLRYLFGFKAKKDGRELEPRWYPEFREDILAANYQKIIQTPGLKQLFMESELPFTHFYVFANNKTTAKSAGMRSKPAKIVIFPREAEWLIDGLEDIRQALKEDRVPECWARAELRYCSNVTDAT